MKYNLSTVDLFFRGNLNCVFYLILQLADFNFRGFQFENVIVYVIFAERTVKTGKIRLLRKKTGIQYEVSDFCTVSLNLL